VSPRVASAEYSVTSVTLLVVRGRVLVSAVNHPLRVVVVVSAVNHPLRVVVVCVVVVCVVDLAAVLKVSEVTGDSKIVKAALSNNIVTIVVLEHFRRT
jgi:hypothetical protein